MMMKPLVLALALASALCAATAASAQAVPPSTASCLTADEAQLAALANQYRQQNGVAPVAVSFSMSSVAQWHVWDLVANDPVGGACNLHSWSNARPGQWTAVCYTADHAQATQMWNKPTQISSGAYTAPGYEIAAGSGGTITPALAMSLWQNSSAHNDVLLNRGIWASHPFRAMGVGMFQGFAVIWFGEVTDPLGTMAPCSAGGGVDRLFANGFEG